MVVTAKAAEKKGRGQCSCSHQTKIGVAAVVTITSSSAASAAEIIVLVLLCRRTPTLNLGSRAVRGAEPLLIETGARVASQDARSRTDFWGAEYS